MKTPIDVLALLPWIDWLALAVFFAAWIGYAMFAHRHARHSPSILAASNVQRRQWMLQTTHRDNRVLDAVVLQNLSSSPSFFASTTILIIGGLLAMLGSGEKATELVREIPFAVRTSELVFDLKLLMLTGVFVYAFFRFTWSLRVYSFGALLMAAAPDQGVFERDSLPRDAFADRAGGVMGLAAESFNEGLRTYYMAFAAIAWFFSAIAFIVATVGVVFVLYQREFRSDVLRLLNEAPLETR